MIMRYTSAERVVIFDHTYNGAWEAPLAYAAGRAFRTNKRRQLGDPAPVMSSWCDVR